MCFKGMRQGAAQVGALCAALVLPAAVQAQAFVNLDFERAVVQPADPNFGFLDWSLAVPGWQHDDAGGADTASVYWGSTHLGLTQWYLLVDNQNQQYLQWPAMQGRFMLAFTSGQLSSAAVEPWALSWIAQTGLVPATARSLHLLAQGPLQVQINGVVQPLLQQAGQDAWALDVSAYAGQVVNLKLLDPSPAYPGGVVVDALRFSSMAVVPEPASALLMGLGVAGLLARLRGRRA